MSVFQISISVALIVAQATAAVVDFDSLMVLLEDVDCVNQTGFRPVGFLALSYKDCVYVVCDGDNPDPALQKYPRACGNGFQTSVQLSTAGGPLFFPASCASMGLTVEQCIAVSSDLCRVEVSTTDNIDCGPTYKDLKESSQLPQADVDLEYKNPYCARNDPHFSQSLLNEDSELCVRPVSDGGARYNIFHRDALSDADIVEIDAYLSLGGGHFIRELFIRVATGTVNVTVDNDGILHVTEDVSSGEPTVTTVFSEDNRVLVITIAFLTPETGGKIVVTLRGRSLSRMNMCIYDPLNIISHQLFNSSMLDPSSFFGYIESLDGTIIPNTGDPGEHLFRDFAANTYDVDTPKVNRTFRVDKPVSVSCWHISDPAQFVDMADFIDT